MNRFKDCNGVLLQVGDKVKRVSDGVEGVIQYFYDGSWQTLYPIVKGDMAVRTSECSMTYSSNHSDWLIIERRKKSLTEKFNQGILDLD